MQPVIAARVRLLRQIGRSFVISFATSSTSIILIIRLPSSNPSVADRINCVNAKIANAKGERRLGVNRRCVQLIKDLEQVCWKTDATGNKLRDVDFSNPARTHASDALGYLIAQKFPMLRGRPQREF